MKNSLYVIAGLLLVIWGIIFWGFNSSGAVNLLLALSGLFLNLIINQQYKYIIIK